MKDESISLYCGKNGSNKEYNIQLFQASDQSGYLVFAQYGPRGAAHNEANKVPEPASYAKAKRAYDALVKQKIGKGYEVVQQSGSTSVPFAPIADAQASIGIVSPQLLNPVEDSGIESLLRDDGVVMQRKYDGERVLIQFSPGKMLPIGINRRGLVRALPKAISDAIEALPHACLIDGELIGECYYAFDLLEEGTKDLREAGYLVRRAALNSSLAGLPLKFTKHFPFVTTATGEAMKRRFLSELRTDNAEGVVFRRRNAPYTGGRPASGGDVLKFKFYETATARVLKPSAAKRSVTLEMQNAAGEWATVGKVTIPPNHEIPKSGRYVEIRYLYVGAVGGALYQPLYLGERDDVAAADCTMAQLKYKAHDQAAA